MSASSSSFCAYRGAVIQSRSDDRADFLDDGLILVRADGPEAGRIAAVGPVDAVAASHALERGDLPEPEGLYLPAFFDTHFHWVQDEVRAMPKLSLIEWLNRYTFPEEARFGDAGFAIERARVFWKRILGLGTIGGLCYSSIHLVALEAAMEYAPEDFRIGNVLMTMECPDFLRQEEAEAIRLVHACAERYGDRYICTPRFAPTTAPEVMRASAEAARANGCFQQTHLDETEAEIAWVLGLYRKMAGFEGVRTYTEIYERVGMLGPRSVFGHCLHLTEDEWRMLSDSGSRIASCPTSNAPIEELGIGSGLFDFERAEAHGIPWSLASDIGGGPFLSMFDVMRSFVEQNEAAGRRASYTRALHRSTACGADLMDLGGDRGRLEAGAFFDGIRVPRPEGDFASGDAEPVLRALVDQLPSREATDELVEATFIRGIKRFERSIRSCT